MLLNLPVSPRIDLLQYQCTCSSLCSGNMAISKQDSLTSWRSSFECHRETVSWHTSQHSLPPTQFFFFINFNIAWYCNYFFVLSISPLECNIHKSRNYVLFTVLSKNVWHITNYFNSYLTDLSVDTFSMISPCSFKFVSASKLILNAYIGLLIKYSTELQLSDLSSQINI